MHKISILMPCYNCQHTLKRAVYSVINQQDWHELIMVDDASEDNTLLLMQNLAKLNNKIKIYSLKKNSGASIARNIAANYASGNILGFLDADDEHVNNIYTFALKFFSCLPQIAGIRFGTQFCSFPSEILSDIYQEKINILLNTFIPNLFVYKSIFNLLGGFPHHDILRQYGGEDGIFSYLLQYLFLVATNYENKFLIHHWHANVHAEKFLRKNNLNETSQNSLVVNISHQIISQKIQELELVFKQNQTYNKGFIPVYIKDNDNA